MRFKLVTTNHRAGNLLTAVRQTSRRNEAQVYGACRHGDHVLGLRPGLLLAVPVHEKWATKLPIPFQPLALATEGFFMKVTGRGDLDLVPTWRGRIGVLHQAVKLRFLHARRATMRRLDDGGSTRGRFKVLRRLIASCGKFDC